LSITEHHDLKDEAHSIHVIALSIPCRKYTPTLGLGTTEDDHGGDGVSLNAVKTSRQMIDFGMDTPRDSLYERTVEVCDIFGVQVKRVPELTVNMNLNLYRVIFTCSEVRCSELRDLGYKGKLVLVCVDNSGIGRTEPDSSGREGLSHIIQFPYRLDALDNFFQYVSQHHTLSSQPKQLTNVDKILFSLHPYEHVPLVLWISVVVRYLSSFPKLHFSDFTDFLASPSPMVTSSKKYPPTSAYTPIAAAMSAGDAPEDVDFEYLINNKIIVSTLSPESIRIADNYVDQSFYSPFQFMLRSEYVLIICVLDFVVAT
jgi:hypothetical protein